MKTQGPKLSGMKDVAKFLGISYGTLYKLVKCGKIVARNIAMTGTKPIYGFTDEDVQAYYDSIQDPAPIQVQEKAG